MKNSRGWMEQCRRGRLADEPPSSSPEQSHVPQRTVADRARRAGCVNGESKRARVRLPTHRPQHDMLEHVSSLLTTFTHVCGIHTAHSRGRLRRRGIPPSPSRHMHTRARRWRPAHHERALRAACASGSSWWSTLRRLRRLLRRIVPRGGRKARLLDRPAEYPEEGIDRDANAPPKVQKAECYVLQARQSGGVCRHSRTQNVPLGVAQGQGHGELRKRLNRRRADAARGPRRRVRQRHESRRRRQQRAKGNNRGGDVRHGRGEIGRRD